MFTGLIEEIGDIKRIERQGLSARLAISAPGMAVSLVVGESVCVDGACLTVEGTSGQEFTAFASEETLSRTTLGVARTGRRVNLERALRLGDRLGGHLVAGHVDATGVFLSLEPRSEGGWLKVRAPASILSVSVPKGSVTLDGISLTLVDVDREDFTVAVIPQTFRATTLHLRQPGDDVNLESDLIGKYVARAAGAYPKAGDADSTHAPSSSILDLLRSSGYDA